MPCAPLITMNLRVRRFDGVQVVVERRSWVPAPIIRLSMTRTDDHTGYGLREAADPTTSPWRLAQLADDADPEVRMVVGANPSASALTVMRLRHDVDPRVRLVVSSRYGTGA